MVWALESAVFKVNYKTELVGLFWCDFKQILALVKVPVCESVKATADMSFLHIVIMGVRGPVI